MTDEQRMILQMVQDGKVTVEEAARLMAALPGNPLGSLRAELRSACGAGTLARPRDQRSPAAAR